MALQDTYKESRLRNKVRRENFFWWLFGLIGASYYLPTMVDPTIGEINFFSVWNHPKEIFFAHEKYFIVYSGLSIALYLFLFLNRDWTIFKLLGIYNLLKQKNINGYFVNIEKLLYPDIEMVDGVNRKELNIFKEVIESNEDKKKLFGSDQENIIKCFKKERDKDFYDTFRVIEDAMTVVERVKEDGSIERLAKYDVLDNNISWDEFYAEKIIDGSHKIIFSIEAIRGLIDVGSRDFSRWLSRSLGKKTRLQAEYFKYEKSFKDDFLIDKAVLFFKFLLFHKLIKQYTGLSVGFLNSRIVHPELRAVLSIYQRTNTTIALERRNDGSDNNFSSDIFASFFLVAWHHYFANTNGLNWDIIFNRFNPLNSMEGGEEDIISSKEKVKSILEEGQNG